MIKKWDEIILKSIAYIVVIIAATIALLPFVSLVISSFTSEGEIIRNGYTLFPKEFSLNAYKLILLEPSYILNAYKVTIITTAVGLTSSLFFSSMAAYVLASKDVKYRSQLAFFIYFTELFNGGLVAFYITVSKTLHLKDAYPVLVLVPLFATFNILILRNFINTTIHRSLIESAKLDGANHFKIFLSIVLPLSKPALASIGLFIVLGYWNDWWTTMMFIDSKEKFSLQYSLYQILSTANISQEMSSNVSSFEMPKESLKLAMTVVSTGPIVLAYPFVQKYFVKGISVGAVKG